MSEIHLQVGMFVLLTDGLYNSLLTDIQLPRPNGEPINLIVAVSFGLFVPPRILNSVEYGGLNVHPSLLPEYVSPIPIYHGA